MSNDFKGEVFECPHCGKRVLVKDNEDHYSCLWCGYRTYIPKSNGGFFIILGVVLSVLLILIFL
jgi:ribosomal protein S27AE